MEAKTVACDLALLLDRLFGGDDASRDVAAVQALGRAAGVVIRRAALWGADDVRKVLNLVAAVAANPRASVDLLTHFAVALELATRRKKRPARFKKHAFASYTDGSPVDASLGKHGASSTYVPHPPLIAPDTMVGDSHL